MIIVRETIGWQVLASFVVLQNNHRRQQLAVRAACIEVEKQGLNGAFFKTSRTIALSP